MTAANPFDDNEALERRRERIKAAHEHTSGGLFRAENINAVLSAAATIYQTATYSEPTSPVNPSDSYTTKFMVATLRKVSFLAEWKSRQKKPQEEP